MNPLTLLHAGLISEPALPVVLLAGGELSHPLTIKVHRASAAAKASVQAAGGKIEILE